jgi:guanylate kinase
MHDGLLLVLSAPSGCGKTTILRRVMEEVPNLAFSVSHTTRTPRIGEVDGVHYYFVGKEEFLAMRDRQPAGFLEWAEVHGNFYGTSAAEVERRQQAGCDVMLDIDVQGAAQVRLRANPVTVFIAPPSLQVLEQRLRGRGSDDDATIAKRLNNARKEMACIDAYDYVIVNDVLEEAAAALRSIIVAERSRRRRTPQGLPLHWSI